MHQLKAAPFERDELTLQLFMFVTAKVERKSFTILFFVCYNPCRFKQGQA